MNNPLVRIPKDITSLFIPPLHTETPWGRAQFESPIAEGITFYSTASHGGIKLSKKRQDALLAVIQTVHKGGKINWLHDAEWWEEDCDWAVPYYFFKDDIRAAGNERHFDKRLDDARSTVSRHHPKYAMAFAEIG